MVTCTVAGEDGHSIKVHLIRMPVAIKAALWGKKCMKTSPVWSLRCDLLLAWSRDHVMCACALMLERWTKGLQQKGKKCLSWSCWSRGLSNFLAYFHFGWVFFLFLKWLFYRYSLNTANRKSNFIYDQTNSLKVNII